MSESAQPMSKHSSSRPRRACWLVGLVLVAAARSGAASAQVTPSSAEATARASLPAALRARIDQLADSARARALPTDPLYEKAAEGVLKNASPERILVVVRQLAADLASARSGLGVDAAAPELVAGAAAIHAGVAAERLSDIARASRSRRDGSLVMPLVVLSDMLQRQVTPALALDAVTTLLRQGASDVQLGSLRDAVEREIERGDAPDLALQSQTAAAVRRLGPPRPPPR